MHTYKGGCHCGAVRFEATMDEPRKGLTCNCSYCSKKGTILTFIPASNLTITQGEDKLTTYQFNQKIIDHQFCSICGVQAFGRGNGPDGTSMAAINLRCIDGIDLHSLELTEYNGKDT